MASLLDLARHGQSVWLDFIDRNLVARGGLQRLVDSGITGVTTNPSIFDQAIGAGRDYDEAIRGVLEQNHEIDAREAITRELEDEGVASFRDSWNKLLAALEEKRFGIAKDFAGQ